MRLINVKAFLQRESLIKERKRVDRRAKVLDFSDDEATEYAILSHRWVGQEVDYDEIVELAKMAVEERDEIRQRDGYQKIIQSCEQAQKDGYEQLWVDTCCIDKRSSAELSEAINSMYRWYENAQVCYAYLHDVPGSSFPTASDNERYPDFSGWPEWFSRGWTLQELIAPNDVQFLNKNWQSIGDKRTLAPTLAAITGVSEHILIHGLGGNRPCVAQVMGSPPEDDASGGQSLFADGTAGREYADVVWRGEESVSPSPAGDHPRIERPKHLCMELRHIQLTDWQYSCR